MKLLYSPSSPFVRKVMAVAVLGGLLDRVERVPTASADPALGNDNPLVKIPVLITDDGLRLFDSRVICEYLDSQGNGSSLFPAGNERWRALRLQALGDGIMDSAVLGLYESRRPENQRSPEWMDKQNLKIINAVRNLDSDVETLAGPPTIGTITVAIALDYVERRDPETDWRAVAPKLAAWHGEIAQQPFMTETAPPAA